MQLDHLSFLSKHASHQRTTFTSHNPPLRKRGKSTNPRISANLSFKAQHSIIKGGHSNDNTVLLP